MFLIPSKFRCFLGIAMIRFKNKKARNVPQRDVNGPIESSQRWKMTTINFKNMEVDGMFEADVSQAGKRSSFQSKSLGYPQMLTASF